MVTRQPGSNRAAPGASTGFWQDWSSAAAARAPAGFAELVERLGGLQDALAASLPPQDVTDDLIALLTRARDLAEAHRAETADQVWGRLLELPTRGQALTAPTRLDLIDTDRIEGVAVFGAFHTGHNGVVHGGAIATVFDDVLGRLAGMGGRPRSRTVSLTVDFRSMTPVDRPLRVTADYMGREGRKIRTRGELWDEDRLCATAEGLFVIMREGQP